MLTKLKYWHQKCFTIKPLYIQLVDAVIAVNLKHIIVSLSILQIVMPLLLNHMVILHPLDFHKDTTTTWIAPGSSRDPMEKSLKSDLHLLMQSLTWVILLAGKRPHGKITEIGFVDFCIETDTVYCVCNKCYFNCFAYNFTTSLLQTKTKIVS